MNENTLVDDVTDDLDAFSSQLFGQTKEPSEPASSKADEPEVDEPVDAPEDDTHLGDNDTPANEDDDDLDAEDDDSDDDDKPSDDDQKPKPKKNRFQERIDELTNARREAERKAAALEERLAKLEQNGKPETPAPVAEVDTGPSPDDKNEDGTEKYPLGEFDPSYIRDLTKHTLLAEQKALQSQREQEKAQEALDAQRAEIQSKWNEKLVPAQERYPDFQEKGQALIDTFDGIDGAYGEYLSSTIMSMEFGPDVLYYLANNTDEATKIVNSGPALATIALGRLEAKFALAEEEKQKARPKVSQAPAPPPRTNKGSAAAQVDVPDDTDDLDAFAEKLFKKRGR